MFIKYLILALIISLLIALFIVGYLLNKRTPRPEGCEEIPECHGCQVKDCSMHPEKEK